MPLTINCSLCQMLAMVLVWEPLTLMFARPCPCRPQGESELALPDPAYMGSLWFDWWGFHSPSFFFFLTKLGNYMATMKKCTAEEIKGP